eukprot:TRINITY_DN1901_c0_g1_i2.p1 TRINITY_DN1901_c0_g1~~TRINITY_DN1901_c0_g1_i2.p1  ORF type:complete len:100 (-),score=13.41 TRINITY_DN1901_c0_g1_i2:75-374(-)
MKLTCHHPLFPSIANCQQFLLMMKQQKSGKDESREIFNTFDKDSDGYISIDDLRTTLKTIPGGFHSEEDLNDMMKVADLEGTGFISFEEFKRVLLHSVH